MTTKRFRTSSTREPAALSRRDFLSGSALAAAALAASSCSDPARPVIRESSASSPRDVLVVVFLRGGMDGLSLCVPHAEDALYALRPTLAIPPPRSTGGAIDLDGFFGLAPAARALYEHFRAGELAIVHAAGLRHPTRSHFDALKNMEHGTVDLAPSGARPGWISRLLGATPPRGNGFLRGIAVERFLPTAMVGSGEALAIADPRSFTVLGRDPADRRALAAMYEAEDGSSREIARNTFQALEQMERTRFEVRQPRAGAEYPDTDFGAKLALTSAWIRARVGVEVLTVDYGGWDHHRNLGAVDGSMAEKLDELARGLSAFARDLGPDLDRVTLVAWSEFGRRAAENASAGLDHGHGGAMLVLGGNVVGGRVHAHWPTLAAGALDSGDLAITTDARDVLAEIARNRMGVSDMANVFPGFTPRVLGVVS